MKNINLYTKLQIKYPEFSDEEIEEILEFIYKQIKEDLPLKMDVSSKMKQRSAMARKKGFNEAIDLCVSNIRKIFNIAYSI